MPTQMCDPAGFARTAEFRPAVKLLRNGQLLYSQASFVQTPINRNPCYPTQNCWDGFLPVHFIPLIWKPRCLTPTWKFRNGNVK